MLSLYLLEWWNDNERDHDSALQGSWNSAPQPAWSQPSHARQRPGPPPNLLFQHWAWTTSSPVAWETLWSPPEANNLRGLCSFSAPALPDWAASSQQWEEGLKGVGRVGEGVRLSKFKLNTDPKEIIRLLEEADAICRQKQWCLVAEAYKMCVYTGFGSLKTIFFSLKSHSWNGRSHHSHLLVSFPPVSGVMSSKRWGLYGFSLMARTILHPSHPLLKWQWKPEERNHCKKDRKDCRRLEPSWWLRWESVCLQCRRPGFYPWVFKIPWRRKFQYSHLENPMDGGVWWATVHGVTKSWTWLSDFQSHFYFLSEELFYLEERKDFATREVLWDLKAVDILL